MVRQILLRNSQGENLQVEEKLDGTLCDNEEKVFNSDIQAAEKGWKIDAIKVMFENHLRIDGEKSSSFPVDDKNS